MKDVQKTIYVYDHFSSDETQLLGQLFVEVVRGFESYSFEFSDAWLSQAASCPQLDPELFLYQGRQYPRSQQIFGMFADASPDRWGRTLIRRRERILAQKEGRKPTKLHDSDYLLGTFDESRMGGLRFKLSEDGPFLADDKGLAAPPWAKLRSLEEASRNFEEDNDVLAEDWLKLLLLPGSSLGGARPKASVQDPTGALWIAKFPSKQDEFDTGAWEMLAHDLADMCGLSVSEARLEKFSSWGSTFLTKRFDRAGEKRLHMASAMTLLAKTDGDSAADGTSYLDLLSFITSYSADPVADARELWRRIVYSMAISNTDDHLRNHAFLYSKKGWRLSPVYDVNPVPFGDELSLNVDEFDNSIDLKLALDVAPRFGLSRSVAEAEARTILSIVKAHWEPKAKELGLSRAQIEGMRPAFSLCYE